MMQLTLQMMTTVTLTGQAGQPLDVTRDVTAVLLDDHLRCGLQKSSLQSK